MLSPRSNLLHNVHNFSTLNKKVMSLSFSGMNSLMCAFDLAYQQRRSLIGSHSVPGRGQTPKHRIRTITLARLAFVLAIYTLFVEGPEG